MGGRDVVYRTSLCGLCPQVLVAPAQGEEAVGLEAPPLYTLLSEILGLYKSDRTPTFPPQQPT